VPEAERLADQHPDTGLGEAWLQLVELVELVAHGVDEVVLSGGCGQVEESSEAEGGGLVALEEGEEEAEGLEALGGRVVHGEHDEGVELEESEDVGDEVVGQDGEHVVHGVEEVSGEGLEGGLVGV